MPAFTTTSLKTMISSHNPEFDSKLGGGIPVGSLMLIEGTSGAGKSVISQLLISGALQDGFTAALFTSENTVRSLVSHMQKLDMDILDYLLLGKFKAYPMALAWLGEDAPTALWIALRQQEKQDLLVVDSLTSATIQSTEDSMILYFFEECQQICSTGKTIIVTLHAEGVSDDLLNPIRAMCDVDLRVRTSQDGQRLVKTLEVSKVRGAGGTTGAIVGFEVEPGWGLRIIPISKARG